MPDIAPRPIVWAGVAIALTVAGAIVAVLLWLHASGLLPGARLAPSYEAQRDAPGLSSAPQDELGRDRREKEQRLHSYGWVDRNGGVAHIPIEDAMELLASRGAGGRP